MNSRQRANAEKRRQGIRPYCRKRTLTSKPVRQVCQRLTTELAELNSKIFERMSGHVGEVGLKAGAPPGNRNALKKGTYTREMFAFRAEVRACVRESHEAVAQARGVLRRGRIPAWSPS